MAFWDDKAVVWPKAEMLNGITMQIVKRQLESLGIPQRQETVAVEAVRRLTGGAVMNSWTPGVPVRVIG